jgi:cyclopropane-fatty-acyl-phospholipid synthase
LRRPQYAKVDLHLDRLDLKPGMTVLDIGCGWGATLKRAIERHDVNVIGLTISRNQHAASTKLLEQVDTDRSRRILLRG